MIDFVIEPTNVRASRWQVHCRILVVECTWQGAPRTKRVIGASLTFTCTQLVQDLETAVAGAPSPRLKLYSGHGTYPVEFILLLGASNVVWVE